MVRMVFDHSEAKGVVEIRRGAYGALVSVDGVELLDVDLFYRAYLGENLDIRGAVAVHLRDPLRDDPLLSMYRKTEEGAHLVRMFSECEDVKTALGCLRYERDWIRLEDTSDG